MLVEHIFSVYLLLLEMYVMYCAKNMVVFLSLASIDRSVDRLTFTQIVKSAWSVTCETSFLPNLLRVYYENVHIRFSDALYAFETY